jgi:hypothetical protein
LVKLPKDGEPWDEVYNKLGRPESPDKYSWETPENFSLDGGRYDMYKQVAHEAGISQAQFEKLASADAEYWTNTLEEQNKEIQRQQAAEEAALKKEWGSAFEERVEIGRRFIAKNLPSDVDKGEILNKIETAIGTANMYKLFANSGAASAEDKIPSADGARPFGYSPEQAKADRKELMSLLSSDPQRLANYNKGVGPDVDKMKSLNKIIAS